MMYSFPVLKNGEILQCLQELEIPISEEHLVESEKHRNTVRAATERLVELCVGTWRRDETTKESDPLYEDASLEIGAFCRSADLMRVCGVSDYGLKDWFWPTSKRVRRNLSAVINFAKFREEQLVEYKMLCEARDLTMAEAEEAKREAREADEEAERIAADTSEARSDAADASVDCDTIEREIAELQAELYRIQAEAWSERAERAEDDAKVAETELAAASSQFQHHVAPIPATHDTESTLLVPDVDAIRSSTRAKEAKKNELSRELDRARACLSELNVVEDVANAVACVQEISNQIDSHKATVADLRLVTAAAAEIDLQIEDLAKTADTVRAKTRATENRLDHVKTDAKRRFDSDMLAVKELKDDLEQLRRDLRRLAEADEDLDARREAVKAGVHSRQDLLHTELRWLTDAAKDLTVLVGKTTAPKTAREEEPSEKDAGDSIEDKHPLNEKGMLLLCDDESPPSSSSAPTTSTILSAPPKLLASRRSPASPPPQLDEPSQAKSQRRTAGFSTPSSLKKKNQRRRDPTTA